jgi:hypothetical protein
MQNWKLTVLPGILAISMTPAVAAPNFVGQSGNIVTPNDQVMRQGELSSGYRHLDKNLFNRGGDMNLYSVNYGLTNKLEAGLAYVERGSDRLLIIGKYRVLSEGRSRPSVSVGVVDLANQLDKDPGAYVILGRRLNGVNLGTRYAVSDRVRVDAALFDFDTVGFGVSFTSGLRLGRF